MRVVQLWTDNGFYVRAHLAYVQCNAIDTSATALSKYDTLKPKGSVEAGREAPYVMQEYGKKNCTEKTGPSGSFSGRNVWKLHWKLLIEFQNLGSQANAMDQECWRGECISVYVASCSGSVVYYVPLWKLLGVLNKRVLAAKIKYHSGMYSTCLSHDVKKGF